MQSLCAYKYAPTHSLKLNKNVLHNNWNCDKYVIHYRANRDYYGSADILSPHGYYADKLQNS